MSHSTKIDNIVFIHNGEYNGNVSLVRDDGAHLDVPFNALRGFVASYVRSRTIARVEQDSDIEILFDGKGE